LIGRLRESAAGVGSASLTGASTQNKARISELSGDKGASQPHCTTGIIGPAVLSPPYEHIARHGPFEARQETTRFAKVHRLDHLLRRLPYETDLDTLRGIEGEGGRLYWAAFPSLLAGGDPQITFTGRSRRPPTDPMNALLSFLYTLLVHDIRAALEGQGLDPQVGYLHRDRPGRPSLALDMMEEFRSVLADRLALTLINRGQLRAQGFHRLDAGGVVMDDPTRRTVITAWQERKRDERRHPFLDEVVPLGLFWHLQALLLKRHMRGDLDGYPPCLWR
jgi:CRISP-associated protein Cas1